jgi:subtilisin-like proprotein convertase family protein
MKKTLLLSCVGLLAFSLGYSQSKTTWQPAQRNQVTEISKNVTRENFPTDFSLFKLDVESLRQKLFSINDKGLKSGGAVVSIPTSSGKIEQFKVYESSNFVPELQAQFPEIRAYQGIGIDDKHAQVRISMDPNGFQAMVFRTDKRNEFIEAYSADGEIYAVFNSSREKGSLPFVCSTEEHVLANSLAGRSVNETQSTSTELLTFRLALSCNAEYANYFGATSAAQSGLVLAGFNATMSRVNGVFEKDLAIHMNIIANTASVIYYNPSTDPYTSMGSWNAQLQNTLTSVIGNDNYDIGHLFGGSGGGGNAGCIGCVCENGKGSGYTSPSNGVPVGDNFDIDYVAHEMGHQFGANHTFSHQTEGSGVNVEPGSGSTIMGYAGITNRNVQSHSDDYFVYASIKQIQDNMVAKSCPVRTPLTNVAPTVNAGLDYTIPKSTPFVLTGVASDPNGDVISYCWEQNDSATSQTGANSAASATKTGGPNWRSYDPVSSPARYFPPLTAVLNNQSTTQGSQIITEALSSVGRTLNFVLTCRDNAIGAGQTKSDETVITVSDVAGPFLVTYPNTNVNLTVGSNQTVTWDVAGTTQNGVNAAYVDILLSTNAGVSFDTILASKVPNDGSETITIPNLVGTTNRIMIKGNNHVFYDLSNANFRISAPLTSTFGVSFSRIAGEQNKPICTGSSVSYEIKYETVSDFSGTTTFSATGTPAGTTVTFAPTSIAATGTVVATISTTGSVTPGFYPITINATSGAATKTVPLYVEIFSSNFAPMALVSPANAATTQNTSLALSWNSNTNAQSYDVQLATDTAFTNVVQFGNTTATTFSVSGLLESTTYYWRVLPKNASCSGTYSTTYQFSTGQIECDVFSSANVPLAISAGAASTINSTLAITETINLSDVNVTMNISHTYVSDLIITLISPSGTQVQLLNGACPEGDNINVTFDDSGSVLICGVNPSISGTLTPVQSLTSFIGQNGQGNWTLRVRDAASGDGGSLNSWSLNLCSVQPSLSTVDNKFSNFVIYPNPNNGNFSVQFGQEISEDMKISVYDIRGRMIFEKNYQNLGLSSQEIQMNNVEAGVYLVTASSGEKKETKRIVIN